MNITLSNLSKTFGDKVAVDINQFEISSGQILGLVGNNGAGKSTLFRLMLDLIKPDSGRVLMERNGKTGPEPTLTIPSSSTTSRLTNTLPSSPRCPE